MSTKLSLGHAVKADDFVLAGDVLSRHKADELLFALEQVGDTGLMRKQDGIFAICKLLKVSAMGAEFA